MPKSKISQADFVSAYRVLSAASGREACTTRLLGRVVGLAIPSVLRRIRLAGLPVNRKNCKVTHKRTCDRGLGRASLHGYSWTNGKPPIPPCSFEPAPHPTALAVLRTYRAIEACSGSRPSLPRVAGAVGVTRQRVHQIVNELCNDASPC